ncbi:tachykinins [Palaemon carinicauda]|uniref:tachykinins n=1 Tax=Palaemon carinicauda TaxID=392227 RepID=UPI002799244F|nr:preprotachykinin A [Palaemon carinicauda]WDS50845.1 preprotachykinin B [Palaemon carinicauda]
MMRAGICMALMGLMLLGVVASVVDAQEPSERERRAPSGFLGMRGKKDYMLQEDDYPMNDPIAARIDAAKSLPIRGKKAPSGFLGMRGKKSDEEVYGNNFADYELEALLKRAPSGFLGMRGKKAPSGFLGMRGKKAPSGFLGMRGKKYDDEEVDALIEVLSAMAAEGQQQKRAPSGFLGMRGKKSVYDEQTDDELSMDKRAPSGFLGMRG